MKCAFFVTGESEDTGLTMWACHREVTEQEMQINGQQSHFIHESLGQVPVLRAWQGLGQELA